MHEGGFGIVRDDEGMDARGRTTQGAVVEGGTLRFVTDDGRSIPRNGYRLEDFVDDGCTADADAVGDASREGFCTTTVHTHGNEVREPAAVYRVTPLRRRAAT